MGVLSARNCSAVLAAVPQSQSRQTEPGLPSYFTELKPSAREVSHSARTLRAHVLPTAIISARPNGLLWRTSQHKLSAASPIRVFSPTQKNGFPRYRIFINFGEGSCWFCPLRKLFGLSKNVLRPQRLLRKRPKYALKLLNRRYVFALVFVAIASIRPT